MSDDDTYCERHNTDYSSAPGNRCPYCEMERQKRAAEIERAMRYTPKMIDEPRR